MTNYVGYILLGAGVLLALFLWLGKPRKPLLPFILATMLIMSGLAILQFQGTDTPSY